MKPGLTILSALLAMGVPCGFLSATTVITEDFESLNAGALAGQNAWAGSADAVVQTGTVNAGTKAASLTATAGYAEQTWSGRTDTDIYVDMYVQPVFDDNGPSDLDPGSTTACVFFNASRHPVVYHGTTAVTLDTVTVAADAFVRVTIHNNYDTDTWTLSINDSQVMDGGSARVFDFYNKASTNPTGLKKVKISGGGDAGSAAFFDDVIVATSAGDIPTSSGIDLRAFQGADGTYVEFVAYDVAQGGVITLYALDNAGNVIWSGSADVVTAPEQVVRVKVPGLVAGQAYDFKVRDEVGKVWDASDVTVGNFAAEMVSMSLTGTTISFNSIAGREYEVKWAAKIGDAWRTAATVTAETENTTLVVPFPDPTAASGFFRVVLK